MEITWDESKNASNIEKHGVSFEEARTVFEDIDALYQSDADSADEARWVVVGMSSRLRVLVVVQWEDEGGEEMRIISARKATRRERATYEG